MLRSILAVAAGFVAIFVLSVGTDLIVHMQLPQAFDAAGHTSDATVLALTIVYVGIFATAGCYLGARLAPNRPMRHALVLGLLGLAFSIAGTAAAWDTAPAWYHVVSLVLVMPYAWAGGRLAELRDARHASPVPNALA
ncbi:MAG TPA: hypothetical protein VFE05_08430 [Longimicrobiaceae bacterium]|jgi:hypothetical protein|nr:hypothetical protein [Longimicrobiaceae bacterium]